MSTTDLRLAANRSNALASTGPTTEAGKAVASANATRHGLLSNRMFLDDEDPEEFATLLIELQSGLAPVGCVELTLVERIAVTLWRQRRLVTAEAGAIALNRDTSKISAVTGKELGRGYGADLKTADLQPFDQDRVVWCNTVIAEIHKLVQIDLKSLPAGAPSVFEQLRSEAGDDSEEVEVYASKYDGGLTGFIDRLLAWCQKELREAANRPRILAMAEQVRARRLILPDDMLDVFSRYQTTLDNQLYKALRALRDAQEWRLKNLDMPAQPVRAASPKAA